MQLKTPKDWQAHYGIVILDPDGWRSSVGQLKPRDFEDEIDQAEFEERMSVSTIMTASK